MKHVKKVQHFVKAHYIISSIIAAAVLLLGYRVFFVGGKKAELFVVKRGDVVQKVIVNGKTKPVNAVDLAFEVSGTVTGSYVKIGSRVFAGETLAVLSQGSLQADLLKAQANLQSEQARLDELKKGTRPEEISIAQTEVENAQVTFDDAGKSLVDKATDIVNNDIDGLFSNPHSSSPVFNLQLSDAQLRNDIQSGRLEVESILITLTGSNINNTKISKIQTLIENVAKAVNTQTTSSSLSQTTLDGYKSNLSSARSALISAKETYNSALSALTLAQKNLSLKQSGSTPEAISAQEAVVLQMQAQVKKVQADISKTIIFSPQNGLVTIQDAKVGETVTAGKPVISVISDNDLEIESNVSEINIGKVALGNPVELKFDAFPGEVFKGVVTYIEPGETIVDGVVNYKVTVAFSEKYPQMKSGLTSKLDIITGTKNDVLIAPQYSIVTRDSGTFVEKGSGKNFTEVPVTVGLKGQDGMVEVLSGLSEGDTIKVVATQ